MRIITFSCEGKESVGILNTDGTQIAPVSAFGLPYADMNELITKLTAEEKVRLMSAEESSFTLAADQVSILSPIPRPKQDVICLGLNYTEHANEAALYSRDAFTKKDVRHAVYFSKRVNNSPGPDAVIPAYEGLVDRLDYEAELAVIIGKDAFCVSREEAKDYIFGYTVLNDVSARNLQTAHTQWYFGKSLDGFTPMGPAVTTADEIPFPPRLKISCRVNDELRQNSTTDMLITGIDMIIEELSKGMTLQAGTIIATGTPKGVGMGFDPPRWLKKGDVVECEIEKIGVLRNRIG
ncbi:MAG: fumarylacetoacetate hydrolase family protein [Clostridia bacterium]|nr:fumarylacetoacetate hydrolase family protein [Clostridia bacterium]